MKSTGAQIAKIRRDLQAQKDLMEQARIVTRGAESEFWRMFLMPMLEEDIRVYSEHKSWVCEGDELMRERGAAQRSQAILAAVKARIGTEEKFRDEANRLAELLDKAEKAGIAEME